MAENKTGDMSDEVFEILRSAVNIARNAGVRTVATLKMHLAHYYPGKETQIDEAIQFWANRVAEKGLPSRYD
jgi:hypothetical protein